MPGDGPPHLLQGIHARHLFDDTIDARDDDAKRNDDRSCDDNHLGSGGRYGSASESADWRDRTMQGRDVQLLAAPKRHLFQPRRRCDLASEPSNLRKIRGSTWVHTLDRRTFLFGQWLHP